MNVESVSWGKTDLEVTVDGPGFDPETPIRLSAQPFARIGSAEHCDVRLENEHVSRVHVYAHRFAEGVFVVDLGTSQGILINGEPAPRGWVPLNQKLSIGPFELSFNGTDETPKHDPLRTSLISGDQQAPYTLQFMGRTGKVVAQPLERQLMILGSAAPSALRVIDDSIAPTHAVFCLDGDNLWTVNLAGFHFYRDHKKVNVARVSTGEHLRVGKYLVVTVDAPAKDRPQPIETEKTAQLEQRCAELIAKVSETTSALQQAESRSKELQQQIDSHQQADSALENELCQVKALNSELLQKVEASERELKESHANYQAKISELETDNSQGTQLLNHRMEELQESLGIFRAKVVQLEADAEKTRDEAERTSEQIRELESAIVRKDNEISTLKTTLDTAEKGQAEVLQRLDKAVQRTQKAHDEEKTELQSQLNSAKDQLEQVTSKAEAAQREVDAKTQQVQGLREEFENQQATIKQLEERVQTFSDSSEPTVPASELESAQSKWEAEKEQLQEVIASKESQIAELVAKVEKLAGQFSADDYFAYIGRNRGEAKR